MHEHAVGVAVIGAAVAVFVRGAAEFGHRHDDDVFHAVAHVLRKRRHGLAQIAQQIRELALRAAFVDVVVPAARIDERDFEADVGLVEAAPPVASSGPTRLFGYIAPFSGWNREGSALRSMSIASNVSVPVPRSA